MSDKTQLDRIESTVMDMDRTIRGHDGKAGIVGRLDRLEQIEAWRKWVIRTLGAAVLIEVGNAMMNALALWKNK